MKHTNTARSFRTVAVTAIIIALISMTALAAIYLLSPSQVANELNNPALSEAFQSDDAVLINKTQSDAGYDISFLGMVSGKGLDGFDETIDRDKTYAVVAIAKQDGQMPAIQDEDYGKTPFFVSPLIKGQTPWQYNIASMNGGYAACVIDGIMYHMIECDNLEMFADRGLSLIVSSTDFYSIDAFDYDEAAGTVSSNPDFDGVNLIFDLPLDTKNADYAKAQEYLDTLWAKNDARADRESAVAPESENNADVTISDSGTTQVMTQETMRTWIENKLSETQASVDRGEYSKENMERDRKEYETYLKAVEDGKTVTLYQTVTGAYMFHWDEDNELSPEVKMNDKGEFEFIFGE